MKALFVGGPMDGQTLDMDEALREVFVSARAEPHGCVGEFGTLPPPEPPLVYVQRKRLPDAPGLSPDDPVEAALWRSRAELVYELDPGCPW